LVVEEQEVMVLMLLKVLTQVLLEQLPLLVVVLVVDQTLLQVDQVDRVVVQLLVVL
jgi:hypothetical protein